MKKWISGILVSALLATYPTSAFALSRSMAADGTWASSGTPNAATALIADAVTGDAVNITTNNTLTVTNNNVANDGGGVNTFVLGAVTNSGTSNALVDIVNNTTPNAALNATLSSASVGSNFSVRAVNDGDGNVVAAVTNALTVGGNLAVTSAEATDDGRTVGLTVGGNTTVTGTTTLTANVGAGGGSNVSLTLNGATNSFTGNVTLDNNTGTATLLTGANATSFSGTILAAGASEGNLTTAGTTAFTGTIGTNANYLGTITQNTASSRLTFNNNVFATNFTQGASNTLDIGANTLDLDGGAGNFTMNATGTLRLAINSATVFGKILVGAGNIVIANTNSLFVTVNGAVTNGQTYAITTGAGNSIATLPTVTDSSPIVSFTLTEPTNDDLLLTATVNTSAISTGASGDAVLGSLSTAVNNGTASTALSNDVGQIYTLSTTEQITAAVNQLDPVTDGATTQTSFQNAGLVNSVVSGRLETARTGNGNTTGISAGDLFQSAEIWAKGFGHFADQDNRGGQDGYDADTWGTIIGIDGPLNDEWRLGVAGGYSNSDVETKNQNSGADIDSVQGTVYGEYTSGPWYLDTSFTFAYNMYDGTRGIAFGTINRVAEADYDGQQYTGYVGTGYTQNVDGWEFTPNLSLTYSHLYLESYTETGANALSLNVASQDYDFLQSGVGLKIARPYKCDAGQWIPEVHGAWLYDFIGDEQATSASFTGGGASFTTKGFDPAQHSFNVGAGITLVTQVRWTVEAVYNLELKEDYNAHSGTLTARYKF